MVVGYFEIRLHTDSVTRVFSGLTDPVHGGSRRASNSFASNLFIFLPLPSTRTDGLRAPATPRWPAGWRAAVRESSVSSG